VNGTRDVVFDRRTALPAVPWLPAAPNTPLKPYWMTHASLADWPDYAVWSGSTASFDLTTSTYDPATKSCGNVGCHLAESPVVWGTPYLSYEFDTCSKCHPNY
jgi:hypothetical protein